MDNATERQSFDSWALVELMGHQRIAGRVTEQQIGGSAFVRVDVPENEGLQAMTKFYGPSAIYALTPMEEQTARALARQIKAAPLATWEARAVLQDIVRTEPKQLQGAPELGVDHYDGGDEDEDVEL